MTAITEARALPARPRARTTRRAVARITDRIATGTAWAIMGLIGLVLAFIVVYVLQNGAANLSWHYLTSSGYETGVAPQIFNTVYMLLLALVPVFIIGVGAAVYISEYARQGFLVRALRFATETLTGTPSIVIGLLCFFVLSSHFGKGSFFGYSRAAGVVALIILNLPWMLRTAEDALRAVPREIREGSMALGANRFQTVLRAVLPAAIPGLTTGVVIVTGRIIGETAALIFSAGEQSAQTGWFTPQLAKIPGDTLAVHIYSLFADNPTPEAYKSQTATAVLLIVFILALNAITRLIGAQVNRAFSGKRS